LKEVVVGEKIKLFIFILKEEVVGEKIKTFF